MYLENKQTVTTVNYRYLAIIIPVKLVAAFMLWFEENNKKYSKLEYTLLKKIRGANGFNDITQTFLLISDTKQNIHNWKCSRKTEEESFTCNSTFMTSKTGKKQINYRNYDFLEVTKFSLSSRWSLTFRLLFWKMVTGNFHKFMVWRIFRKLESDKTQRGVVVTLGVARNVIQR